MRPVIVPDFFFTDLLPLIDDLAELKLTLHCFWLLNEQEGSLRYLRGDDLRDDTTLLDSLSLESDLRTPLATLEDALERSSPATRCCAWRSRLAVMIPSRDELVTEDWYFINTVKGRQTLALIRQGKLQELQAVIPERGAPQGRSAQHLYAIRAEYRLYDAPDRRPTARYGANLLAGLDR